MGNLLYEFDKRVLCGIIDLIEKKEPSEGEGLLITCVSVLWEDLLFSMLGKDENMKLIGERVTHIKYGEGTIINQYDNKMEVDFGTSIKKFVFPDSFESFFIILDKKVEDYIHKRLHDIHELKRKKVIRKEIEMHRKTLKIKDNSHAVFALKEEEVQEVMDTWEVRIGSSVQGAMKGKVRIPQNLNMNSACVLTYKEKGKSESQRVIVGIFMVEDHFIGAQCDSDHIVAHKNYRILCDSNEEEVYFWDYFPEEKRLKNWGSSKMKYLSGSIVRTIVNDIYSTTSDEHNKEELKKFTTYFCEVNQL